MRYLARVTKEGRHTLIDFPDCPGCQTFASAREDVTAVAREALEGWLAAHLVSGDAPPKPRTKSSRNGASRIAIRISPALAVRLQLRWARLAAGLSQTDLARRVGVTRQQISLLESPDANLTLATLDRVARALGMDLAIELHARSSAA